MHRGSLFLVAAASATLALSAAAEPESRPSNQWRAVDATGAELGPVFFLEPEHLATPSHYRTPFVVLEVEHGVTPDVAGFYGVPLAAAGYTNVEGVGSPLGSALAYATADCSDTPVIDMRVVPHRNEVGRRDGPAPAARAGFVIPKAAPGRAPGDGRSHELWIPIEGAVELPLVAQRFEADGPCFEWAPIIGPEDEAHLRRARFGASLPEVTATPLRFEQHRELAAADHD